MKTPGKFGPVKALTPEERMDELDRKFTVILDRIQYYDKILVEFSNVKSTLSGVLSDQQAAKESTASLSDYVQASHNFAVKNAASLQSSLTSVAQQLSTVVPSIQEAKNQTAALSNNLYQAIGVVDAKHTQNSQSYVVSSDIHELDRNISNALNKVYSHLEINSNKIQDLGKLHNDLSQQNSELKDSLSSVNGKLGQTNDALAQHVKNTDFSLKSIKSSSDAAIENVKDQVVSYMNATKVEMIGSPSSMESVRKEIMHKLSLTSLDGSNAVLKTNNHDQQLKIIEKKLENLSILMKKNEFDKM